MTYLIVPKSFEERLAIFDGTVIDRENLPYSLNDGDTALGRVSIAKSGNKEKVSQKRKRREGEMKQVERTLGNF